MRAVMMWIVPLIVVAGIVLGVSYLQGDVFHRGSRPLSEQADVWIPVPHPPGDRVQPSVPMVKEFGAWHLACIAHAQEAPKVGFVQNLGVVSTADQNGKPGPCHVFIMMRDRAAPRQTMVMEFRNLTGVEAPRLTVIYTPLGNSHVLYDPSGQTHDLSRKEKWKGGFYTDPDHSPGADKLKAEARAIPKVEIQLGDTSLTVPTRICFGRRCFASLTTVDTAGIGPGSSIVVRIPGPPRGQPREVAVPSNGLAQALAKLQQLNAA